MGPSLQLIAFKFKKSFLLDRDQVLLLHFFNALLHLLLLLFDCFYLASNAELFTVDTILMMFVEVALFSKLLPSGLSIFSNDLGLLEFTSHSFNFCLHFGVFVFDVRNKTDAQVLESTFLLELIPLLLKYIHGLGHLDFGQEVSDKVVNHDISFDCSRGNRRLT